MKSRNSTLLLVFHLINFHPFPLPVPPHICTSFIQPLLLHVLPRLLLPYPCQNKHLHNGWRCRERFLLHIVLARISLSLYTAFGRAAVIDLSSSSTWR